MENSQEPWVLCRINGQLYGISAYNTQEMVTIPDVTDMPKSPDYIRGIINLRGSVLALLDLRMKLNMPSLRDEQNSLIDNMKQRKQEHIDWVNALERSVDEGIPFTLTRDPQQCMFGKWYRDFTSRSNVINAVLVRFDLPHRGLHAAADEVIRLLDSHQPDKAKAAVQKLRETHQKEILQLFDELDQILHSNAVQEVAVVVKWGDVVLALTVDSLEGVEPLKHGSIEKLPDNMQKENGYVVNMLGRRNGDDEPVLIPDLDTLMAYSRADINKVITADEEPAAESVN